ncbi:MAG TPA: cobalt-precorrin-5B (C(1))-methyltransferase [Stellaceae bacterium]|nr:cobalt-precorrin-5B (C(1))-methyltransferase [Stellaceae bacterium]
MPERPKALLRRGWTTGACAAAASRAAFEALITGTFPDPVAIDLPGGAHPSFPLALKEMHDGVARAGIVKDAGDDPDVTHGALVIAELRRAPRGSGIQFRAGPGIGTVTLAGLALPVGAPAINPGPRAMIAAALETLEPAPDLDVTLSIPGGEALAAKTMNGRLGIVGGLSILGTTGVVVPYSCSAWIASIERGIDVARAAGLTHIAAATGRTSEAGVRKLLDLPELALIDMGDFVGGVLKYLRRHPVPRLTLAGGIAKMAKLAEGHLDLHSARSRIAGADLARRLERAGAPDDAIAACAHAASAGAAFAALDPRWTSALASSIAQDACAVARARLGAAIAVDAAVFDRQGGLLAHEGA